MWTLPSEPWCTPNKQPFKGILVHFQTNFGAVQLIDEFIQTSQKHDVMAWCDHTKGPLFWILHKCYNVFVTIPSFVRMCHERNKSSTQHCFGCSVSSQNIYLNSFPAIDGFFQHVWDSASPPLIEFSDSRRCYSTFSDIERLDQNTAKKKQKQVNAYEYGKKSNHQD